MNKNFIGQNGFHWFIGIIENNNDPLKLKRFQVRINGLHDFNKQKIPTEILPWAENSTDRIFKPGDLVYGFFLDGHSSQHPVIFGGSHGIPEDEANQTNGFSDQRTKDQLKLAPRKIKEYKLADDGTAEFKNDDAKLYPHYLNEPTTSKVLRNEDLANTVFEIRKLSQIKKVPGVDWFEPDTSYNSIYPYNHVIEGDSGHLFEIDDTPEKERIHLAHRTGSYNEFHPDGSVVNKSVKNKFDFTHGNSFNHINGSENIVIGGSSNIYIIGDSKLNIDGNLDWNIKGNWKVNIDGKVDINIKDKLSEKVKEINIDTPKINTTGQIISKGDQIAGGVSQINHLHTGVTAGDDISGPPVGGSSTISDSTVAAALVAVYEA